MFDQGIGNLSSAKDDSPLRDILSSFLKHEWRVPILRSTMTNTITNTSTDKNVLTQDSDTAVHLKQFVDELENRVSPPVICERIKGYFCSDTVSNLS